MKTFICAVISLILIIAGGILYSNYLKNVSQVLTEFSDEVISACENEDFRTAKNHFSNLKQYYLSKEKILYMTMNHEQVSAMSTLMKAVEQYLLCRDKNHALAYTAMLRSHFFSLPIDESFSFENVI